jgi:hypothetical protein
MREKIIVTVVCPNCEGKGWKIYPPNKGNYRQSQICRKCHGLGKIRTKDQMYYSKAKQPKPKKVLGIVDEFSGIKNKVARFIKRHPDRWHEIQNKYRKSPKYQKYMRDYMKVYRAKLRGEKVETPAQKIEIKPRKLCTECQTRPPMRKNNLCSVCLRKHRVELYNNAQAMDEKKLVQLRNIEHLTFAEIGRIFGVTRQRAHQVYVKVTAS